LFLPFCQFVFVDSNLVNLQSNFRADQAQHQLPVKNRISTEERNVATAQATSSKVSLSNRGLFSQAEAKQATIGIKGRLSLKPEEERKGSHQKITAPRPDDAYKR